jgi:hypothetical protein
MRKREKEDNSHGFLSCILHYEKKRDFGGEEKRPQRRERRDLDGTIYSANHPQPYCCP